MSQCEQVDAGLVFESRKVDFPFIFDIKTKDRTYYLVTQTEEEMNEWVTNICSLCGFKVKDEAEQRPLPDPSSGRPASTPAGLSRRPPSEPLVNINNNTVNSLTMGHGQGMQHQRPAAHLHHTIASASRRASSPATASRDSRARHVSSNSSTSTAFSSVCSDLNGRPESSPFRPATVDEDEERGSYIPLVECVSGRKGNDGFNQSVDSSAQKRPSMSSTWHPQPTPRPALSRLGDQQHNPSWYDIPSASFDAVNGSAQPGVDDQLYKEAPIGRGSIVETWYQCPKTADGETAPAKSAKKPLPLPPTTQSAQMRISPTESYDFPSQQGQGQPPHPPPPRGNIDCYGSQQRASPSGMVSNPQRQSPPNQRQSPPNLRQSPPNPLRQSPSGDSVDGAANYDSVVRPPRPPKPSHLQSPSSISNTDPNLTQYDFPPPKNPLAASSKDNSFTSLTVPRNTTYRGQKEENSASVTGSTGSVQPSPRFDRRDHGSLQNLVGGGGSGGNSAATPTFLAPASAGFGPTKTNSFPSELYDTPSSHMAGNPAAVAESWYSSPASHRQGSQEIAAASSNTSNTRLSSPGARKASPMKLRTDLAQVLADVTPPRIDRDLKPRRPSTDCPTPSPSRSPVEHASGNGTRSGDGSLDSIPDHDYGNLLHLPMATKRTQSFQRTDRLTPVKTTTTTTNNPSSSSEVVLPSRCQMPRDDDSSSDDESALSHELDNDSSPRRRDMRGMTPGAFGGGGGSREYTLDQKIPAPDPSQFLPPGGVEYIEVEPDMAASTIDDRTPEDAVSIISNMEPTHYTPIDFHRTKGLIESKRENEREKLLAS